MIKTNKEIELLEIINKIKEKNYVSINDFEFLQDKIGEVIVRKNQQLEEMKYSRDNWKGKYMELKNENKK